MTDHLPECPMSILPQPTFDYVTTTWPDDQVKELKWECICPLLRAGEQRVMEDVDIILPKCTAKSYREGYAAALAAAEAAVANIQGPLYSVRNSGDAQQGWDAHNRHAVAAIRALREDKP